MNKSFEIKIVIEDLEKVSEFLEPIFEKFAERITENILSKLNIDKKPDQIFSRKEFMKSYGMCSTSLYNKMKEGLPSRRRGRLLFFSKIEVDEYFKNESK